MLLKKKVSESKGPDKNWISTLQNIQLFTNKQNRIKKPGISNLNKKADLATAKLLIKKLSQTDKKTDLL